MSAFTPFRSPQRQTRAAQVLSVELPALLRPILIVTLKNRTLIPRE